MAAEIQRSEEVPKPMLFIAAKVNLGYGYTVSDYHEKWFELSEMMKDFLSVSPDESGVIVISSLNIAQLDGTPLQGAMNSAQVGEIPVIVVNNTGKLAGGDFGLGESFAGIYGYNTNS